MPAFGDGGNDRQNYAAAAALTKQRDRDRYWSTLFAPPAKRPALLALYAFNAELARISGLVKEPMVGQIRLQWWRDAIDLAAPDRRTGNPVADALATTILNNNLPKELLVRMVDGRLPEIFGDPPLDITALRACLQETNGVVFEVAAAILGDTSEAARKAAEHAGLAYGLMEVLATLPVQASRRKLMLPPSYLENRGIDVEIVFRGKANASFKAALADLRGASNRALQQFRSLSPELHMAAWPAFLPLAIVKPYLKAMSAPDFKVLQTAPHVSPLKRFWKIWRAAMRRAI